MHQKRLRSTTVLAAGVLAAVTALSGCGGLSLGGSASSSTGAAPASSTSAPSPTSEAPTVTAPSTSSSGTSTAPTTSAPSPSTSRPTPKPSPSKPAPTPTTPKPKPTPVEGDTLHVGDTGPYVRSVQQRLSDLGYWNGTPDGQYGGLTAQAVMALQKAAGLGRDGVYGPSTRQALKAGVRPVSRIGGTGIEIDKARQLLLVVRGGAVTMVLNTSTGSGQPYTSGGVEYTATTPVGTYSVFRSVDHLDKGPLGDLWRPRYFNGGIAVHGAGSVPGYPASHGCARVTNAAMDMIWATNTMPIGSRVVVY
ncbi:L,D-transpeptidase family protein [Phycicoccus sp. Soil748]|uniref:L,D-transpeptidase family protein n=1 Tax=Intrasporangiaceae TaxID=85021 RepID=UPI0009EB17AE|nr:L,D-transpeptidase family protein [Phycicoccus sp. Soil748]